MKIATPRVTLSPRGYGPQRWGAFESPAKIAEFLSADRKNEDLVLVKHGKIHLTICAGRPNGRFNPSQIYAGFTFESSAERDSFYESVPSRKKMIYKKKMIGSLKDLPVYPEAA